MCKTLCSKNENHYCKRANKNGTNSTSHCKILLQIGAPPEVVARLEEVCTSAASLSRNNTSCIGEDPALDQFMEAYCEMLTKYEEELSKPFKEAMLFLSRVECQFKALTLASSDSGRWP